MLKLFVADDVYKRAMMDNHFTDETEIEVIPEKVSDAVLDKSVNIELIKTYFTLEGWITVQHVLETKKLQYWPSFRCLIDLNTTIDGNDVNKPDAKISVFYDYRCLSFHLKNALD